MKLPFSVISGLCLEQPESFQLGLHEASVVH